MIHADACISVISSGPVPARHESHAEIKTKRWAILWGVGGGNLHIWVFSKRSRMVGCGSSHAPGPPAKPAPWDFAVVPVSVAQRSLKWAAFSVFLSLRILPLWISLPINMNISLHSCKESSAVKIYKFCFRQISNCLLSTDFLFFKVWNSGD